MRRMCGGTHRSAAQRRAGTHAAFALLLAVTVTASACEGGRATSSFSTRAIVHGTITDAAGAPVVGAVVRAFARPGTCGSSGEAVATGQPTVVVTDANGDYGQMLAAGHSPFEGCVTVEILAPGGSSAVLATATGAPLSFTPSNEQAAYDSLRVDVQLP